MKNKKIFELFEKEKLHKKLHKESNLFGKEEIKEKDDGHNNKNFEFFDATSMNYFKESKNDEDNFNYDTDNECPTNFDSKKDLKNIIYNHSTYKESDFIKLSKLGSNDYGQVYKVKNKNTNKIYALKEINKLKLIKQNKPYQILIEKEIFKFRSNTNIVKYYGSYENERTFSIIEEYYPFGDLSTFLNENKQKLTFPEIQYIIAQIIICLESLSTKNIVHRDIKPENFLIADNFNLKLKNFSTATFFEKKFDKETNRFIDKNSKAISRDSFDSNLEYIEEDQIISNESHYQCFQQKITDLFKFIINPFLDSEVEKSNNLKQQKYVGTAEYMAPEVINSKEIGYYTDIWSAICILFLCFTDNTPFNDKTEYLIFQNISNIKIKEEYLKLIPDDALDLIKNFFKLNPSERIGYKSHKDFDFDKIKSHPFFMIKDSNLSLNQIRQNLMNKNYYFLNSLLIKNINYKNIYGENKKEQNETILKSGFLKKQIQYIYYEKQKIILYDTPRIDYIIPHKSIKGTINLTRESYAELIRSNKFKLYTPERTYVFMCKERYDISPWVISINNAIEKYC